MVVHCAQACVISSVLSSFCCFLSFVIYAGVVNTNKVAGTGGSFGGGFGLILWGTCPSPPRLYEQYVCGRAVPRTFVFVVKRILGMQLCQG